MTTRSIGRIVIGCLTAGPIAGLALAVGPLAGAPSSKVIDALGWVWPPLVLALVAWTVVHVHRYLHSRTRLWVVYPLLGVYTAGALGAGYQTVRESLDHLAALSTNSSHRVVPYSHDALVNDQTAAQTSSQAIRDVVDAVRSGAPLKKS